ncbi:CDP-alcohol phosphatidyltransferase family protein [Georgenia muralis]|uniref:CDP-alcohol phosphatidyltransferase-like enzyme n=1 Tax=Georgenia muralis TaxID=154117 RepID=A0A3N4ZTX4_9MICO|nr:CDP-alcohol phosphatidyltransferase family protein [Georgenia muralis]RPF28888.1 CDP-alcohol phosphatidyltransferase-like enzyme [Georgenia muralis]
MTIRGRAVEAGHPAAWHLVRTPAALALGLFASLAVPLVLLATGTGGPGALVGPGGYLVGAAVLDRAVRRTNEVAAEPVGLDRAVRGMGAANVVTLVRLVLVTWIASLLPALAAAGEAAATSAVLSLAVLLTGTGALLLDGADGRVARRRGETSASGARFDSETDAALVLVLAVAVAVTGSAGWWVLAIGLMRYGQLAAAAVAPWLRGPVSCATASSPRPRWPPGSGDRSRPRSPARSSASRRWSCSSSSSGRRPSSRPR